MQTNSEEAKVAEEAAIREVERHQRAVEAKKALLEYEPSKGAEIRIIGDDTKNCEYQIMKGITVNVPRMIRSDFTEYTQEQTAELDQFLAKATRLSVSHILLVYDLGCYRLVPKKHWREL